jgi:hypothetical protein
VLVHEVGAPNYAETVEWKLLTNLPIDTPEQVAAIVDAYRARWVIEEFFKALKTGCAYEKRQLETFRALMNALAIFSVIAWRLLVLRHVASTIRAAQRLGGVLESSNLAPIACGVTMLLDHVFDVI